jgi:hypothetical protein
MLNLAPFAYQFVLFVQVACIKILFKHPAYYAVYYACGWRGFPRQRLVPYHTENGVYTIIREEVCSGIPTSNRGQCPDASASPGTAWGAVW